jgi:hypothetical protein
LRTATELQVKNIPLKDTASLLGVSKRLLIKWNKEAVALGLVEEIREKFASQLLPKAANIYDEILSAKPEDLKEIVKARELQLKAAKEVATGVGAFRASQTKTTKSSESLDLQGYIEMAKARKALAAQDMPTAREILPPPIQTFLAISESEVPHDAIRRALPERTADAVQTVPDSQRGVHGDDNSLSGAGMARTERGVSHSQGPKECQGTGSEPQADGLGPACDHRQEPRRSAPGGTGSVGDQGSVQPRHDSPGIVEALGVALGISLVPAVGPFDSASEAEWDS